MNILINFTEDEMVTILEVARVALCDADLFDHVADKLDLFDGYMLSLRDKLQEVMDSDDQIS